jgi:hypothetical protein
MVRDAAKMLSSASEDVNALLSAYVGWVVTLLPDGLHGPDRPKAVDNTFNAAQRVKPPPIPGVEAILEDVSISTLPVTASEGES